MKSIMLSLVALAMLTLVGCCTPYFPCGYGYGGGWERPYNGYRYPVYRGWR